VGRGEDVCTRGLAGRAEARAAQRGRGAADGVTDEVASTAAPRQPVDAPAYFFVSPRCREQWRGASSSCASSSFATARLSSSRPMAHAAAHIRLRSWRGLVRDLASDLREELREGLARRFAPVREALHVSEHERAAHAGEVRAVRILPEPEVVLQGQVVLAALLQLLRDGHRARLGVRQLAERQLSGDGRDGLARDARGRWLRGLRRRVVRRGVVRQSVLRRRMCRRRQTRGEERSAEESRERSLARGADQVMPNGVHECAPDVHALVVPATGQTSPRAVRG
jgi:hypothetical protein